MNISAMVLAIALFVLGLLGTVLPVLPGAILVFGGMLLFGFLTDFATLGVWFFVVEASLLVITFVIDYIASAIGTRIAGGSKWAALGAVVATIPALIVFGPLGIILGPLIGSVGVELLRGIPLRTAWRVGVGTLMGSIGGTLSKLGIEIVMIVFFFIAVL